jgi:hypothetical protein
MIEIYGSSDDLVEIEGGIDEEFPADGAGPHYLAFSDGTLLSIDYGREGIWRINRLATGSADYWPHQQFPNRTLLVKPRKHIFSLLMGRSPPNDWLQQAPKFERN